MKLIKYKIITKDGFLVCDNLTHSEGMRCLAELIKTDKEVSGVYEKDFYNLVKQ